MIRNYLLIAWRSFTKNKAYSFLNIFGLTFGITCSIVIFLYVQNELTYDHNHSNLKDIYRVNGTYHLPNSGGREDYALCGPGLGEVLPKDFPEIKELVRIARLRNVVVEKPEGDEQFYEQVYAADSNIFKVFTFPFIAGDPTSALLETKTLVISERMAMKYFNTTDVVGKSLRFPTDSADLKISGVFSNPPNNTQFKLDFIISIETYRTVGHVNLQNWWNYGYYTYVLLNPNSDVKAFEDKIKFISRNYIADQEDGSGYRQEYSLTPFAEVHLHSALRNEFEANGKASYVYIFLIIGIFTLVIACINFMNLATARSAMRAKEIGLRKVVGAFRLQLIGQFLGESFLMTICAVIISVITVTLLMPKINTFTNKELELITNGSAWTILAGIVVFVGLLAGSYPSLFLSAFKPTETLKGNFRTSSKGNQLRKALVIFQFTISTFLIAGTIVIYNHIHYLRSIDLGFDKDRILSIPTRFTPNASAEFSLLKEELKKLSSIGEATLSSRVPGMEMGNNVVRLGWDESAAWNDMRFITVDHDFVETYNLKLVEGRSFDENYPTDAVNFLVNESGMRRLGWNNPGEAIGQKLSMQGRKGEVIGVVKDFHFMASNIAIEPFIMIMNSARSVGYLSLKINSGNLAETITQIEHVFRATLPDRIFEYQFLDEDFDKQYKAEDQFMTVFSFFALVAIVIACLGLYGLAMFMAELRLREMGIRKVLGATEQSLFMLFTKDFTVLVFISALIALPLTYWSTNTWLATFPMHEKINPVVLILSAVVALFIAMLTTSIQSIKASRTNPVDCIRD
jgi:putative ABC transport system permease protein